LFLPPAARVGWWLPVHLTLAGAASVAICGAMQTFVLAMTATRMPPVWKPHLQFGLVNAGVAAVALGYLTAWRWLFLAGAAAYLGAILLLADLVWTAWRRALNRRHWLPISLYAAAIACLLVGASFGAVVGSQTIGGDAWVGLRRAHLILNVLGWVSLTIAGTLITFLPTVLRVRMPAWRGRTTMALLVAGVAALAAGSASAIPAMVAAGALLYTAGAVGIAWMAVLVARTPRKWPVPIAAKHLVLALSWFVGGSAVFAVQAIRGSAALTGFATVFLVVFVGGWIVQTLLGAWEFLLPMWRAGHPEERRRSWAAVELLGTTELVTLNVGLLILAVRVAAPEPGTAGAVGAALALLGAGLALVKAWGFRQIARGPVVTPRTRAMWWAE
jgi:nitrite reductase (NO-forming)